MTNLFNEIMENISNGRDTKEMPKNPTTEISITSLIYLKEIEENNEKKIVVDNTMKDLNTSTRIYGVKLLLSYYQEFKNDNEKNNYEHELFIKVNEEVKTFNEFISEKSKGDFMKALAILSSEKVKSATIEKVFVKLDCKPCESHIRTYIELY